MKNKKALWIACAFLAVLLLGIAAAGWFSGSAGQRYSGEADAPYPYAWVEKRDGTVLLSLNAGESADGVWSAEAPGGTAEISLAAAKDGGTSALLKPRAAGREALLFRLHGGGALLAETVLTVEARETEGGRLALAVISHRQQAVQSRTDGGGARGCPFTASAAETGALLLHISDPDMAELYAADKPLFSGEAEEPPRWIAASSDALTARPDLCAADETGVTFLIASVADGEARIAVSCKAADVTYLFSVAARNGTVRLTDYSESAYIPAHSAVGGDAAPPLPAPAG